MIKLNFRSLYTIQDNEKENSRQNNEIVCLKRKKMSIMQMRNHNVYKRQKYRMISTEKTEIFQLREQGDPDRKKYLNSARKYSIIICVGDVSKWS